MVFDGYLEYSGTEIINSARTLRYAAHQAPGLGIGRLLAVPESLHVAVGDRPYESPLVDDAPWFDPAVPASADFFGLYPLEVQGLLDSTLSASVTERIDDGGSVGNQREGSKSVRVRGLMMASSELGIAAGMAWLRSTLRMSGCTNASPCGGADLRFFLAEPKVAPVAFGADTIGSLSEQFGQIQAGELTSHRWTDEEASVLMPAALTWTGSFQEGSGFRYGAKDRLGNSELAVEGPVFPYRRNYATNPSMRTSLTGYAAGSQSVVSWVLEGGVDGAGFARVLAGSGVIAQPVAPTVVSSDRGDGTGTTSDATSNGDGTGSFPFAVSNSDGTGTLPDPPGDFGSVFGAGVFGSGVFGGAPGTITDAPGTRLISSATLPTPAGDVVASVSVRAAVGTTVTLSVLDGLSSLLLGSSTWQTTGDWDRVGATAAGGTSGVQVVVAADGDFDVDLLLVERGGLVLDYFDGASLVDGATVAWEGIADGSSSVLTLPGLEFCYPDSGFRPFLECIQGGADQVKLTWQLRRRITLDEQLLALDRSYHGVTCTQGISVVNEIRDRDGWFTEIDFVLTAEQPGVYAPPVDVPTIPVATAAYTDPAVSVELDDQWLYDPNGLAPTVPPSPPTVIPDGMVQSSGDWLRYYVTIPADDVALGAKTVPTIGIVTTNQAASGVRIRFHANPFDYPAASVDPLSYCSETIVSYLPPQTRLVLNGVSRQAMASKAGKATVAADHLIYGTDGTPVTWPDLSCGVSYVLTVDVPAGSSADDFVIDLQVARRE